MSHKKYNEAFHILLKKFLSQPKYTFKNELLIKSIFSQKKYLKSTRYQSKNKTTWVRVILMRSYDLFCDSESKEISWARMYGSWWRQGVTYHQSVQILFFFTTKVYEFWCFFLWNCTNIGTSRDVPDVPHRTSVPITIVWTP